MTKKSKPYVFLVDDEPLVLKVISRTLKQLNASVTCFTSAADCLEQLRLQTCNLLITDVKMPKMDGIELLAEVKRITPSLPVLVMTAYGDIPMSVSALKLGAVDFIEKPINRDLLLSRVESALEETSQTHPRVGEILTKTEIKVLNLIMKGKSTREIAQLRHRSIRTIEDERRRIMRKLDVDNLVDLVKKVAIVRLAELPEKR
jgi:two-component system response regulator FixJ